MTTTTAQCTGPDPTLVTITPRGDKQEVTCSEHGLLDICGLPVAAEEIRRWHLTRDHGPHTITLTFSPAEYAELLSQGRKLGMDPRELLLDTLRHQLRSHGTSAKGRHLVAVS